MKTVCIMDSVSRVNGGIFEAERRLQQNLQVHQGVDVQIVGLQDVYTDADRDAWLPLVPTTVPVTGPNAFGYAPELFDAITSTGADLGYHVGLWKYPSVAAQRWSGRTGKPLMIAPHGMLDPWAVRHSGFKKKIAGWLFQNEQLRRATCVRALCDAEADSIRAYGLKNPICVVPNGVDLPVTPGQIPRHRFFPKARKVLLYLGRLHPKKGLANLVAAWGKAGSVNKDWVLAIAGWDQGGHEADLKTQATKLGIAWADGQGGDSAAASLLFPGPQFEADKAACYQSCDAFILPSFSEGLPMVILEAWAYGKPVLMTDECNLPEGFSSHSALRIKTTPESIAGGLRQLMTMSNGDLQTIGARGRALAENRFAWPKVAAEMGSVYEWMLGGGPAPRCVKDA